MNLFDILLLAVALSMDAVAVSMTNGMTNAQEGKKAAVISALLFGVFQAAMPLIGYYVTEAVSGVFREAFEAASKRVAFALLAFIGGKMLFDGVKEMKNAREKKANTDSGEAMEECAAGAEEKPLSIGVMLMQAVATSIDALAVGISLKMAAIGEGLFPAIGWSVAVIGCVTFVLSVFAVKIGRAIGDKLSDKAGVFGGATLILIGLKILLF